MSAITINDVGVLSGTIMMPLVGVWTADLVIDQPDGLGFEPGEAVKIVADNGVELDGVVSPDRTGDFLDAVHVRVLGGKGGMAKDVTPKAFMQPGAYVRDVLKNITDSSGETLSDTVASSFTQSNLAAWNTVQVPAAQALTALLHIVAPAFHWRILADGTLWMGEETWDDATPEYVLLEQNPTEGTYDLGVDAPSIVPGITVDGIGKINRVQHIIEAGKLRSHVWVQLDQPDRGIKGAISALVRQEIAGIDYFTLYDAKITAQSGDGKTVDLEPGDTRLPSMGGVPLRNGVAGTVCKVVPGAFVRLGWDRGNPSMPYACLWQGGETVTEISIDATLIKLAGGSQFVALANLVAAELTKIQTAITGVGGSYTPGSVTATKVKAT